MIKKVLLGGLVIFLIFAFLYFQKSSPTLNKIPTNQPTPVVKKDFVPPLPDAKNRVTKKPFDIYITPKTSPVQPERFTGYHTGADFEVFPSEENAIVSVTAVCTGTARLKEYVSGYGGVFIENCLLKGQPITVLYGHLNLASIPFSPGASVSAGQKIGELGKGYSNQTDGERKHLHLGVHLGNTVDLRGYVQNQSELSEWINPVSLF